MRKLKNFYENIFYEIEGQDTDTKILWQKDNELCVPKFTSKKQYKYLTCKTNNSNNSTNNSGISEPNNSLKLNSTEIMPNDMAIIDSPSQRTNLNNEIIEITKQIESQNEKEIEKNRQKATQLIDNCDVLSVINSEKRCASQASNLDIDTEQLDFLRFDNLKNLSVNELESARENVSFELLWIQQAIESRMNVSIIELSNIYRGIFNSKIF